MISTSKPTYSWQFIEDIARFQNYGASVVTKSDLDRLRKDTPTKFKKVAGITYRIVGLNLSTLKQLYSGKGFEYKRVSSWSYSLDIAKNFIKSIWFEEFNDAREKVAVILKKKLSSIIVDIDALHKDKDFRSSVEYYENEKRWFDEGLEFGGDQKEVIAESHTLKKPDLFLVFDSKKGKWKKPPKVYNDKIFKSLLSIEEGLPMSRASEVLKQLEGLSKPLGAKWMGPLPSKCDICNAPLKDGWVDGVTKMGPWANMCKKCHKRYGRGIGLGVGQEYDGKGVKIGG